MFVFNISDCSHTVCVCCCDPDLESADSWCVCERQSSVDS